MIYSHDDETFFPDPTIEDSVICMELKSYKEAFRLFESQLAVEQRLKIG